MTSEEIVRARILFNAWLNGALRNGDMPEVKELLDQTLRLAESGVMQTVCGACVESVARTGGETRVTLVWPTHAKPSKDQLAELVRYLGVP